MIYSERENAGLNVTCASRVFLLESVVNHAFELQAIARVDRMGQRRETEGDVKVSSISLVSLLIVL
jgi:E3 ubiquitin-protein ligase SHPRH